MKKYIFVLSLVVFIIAAALAHHGFMLSWEISLFTAIYDWPRWLTPVFLAITMAGSSWMVAALTTYLVYKKRISLALQVVMVGIFTYSLVEIAKRLVDRPRPFVLLPNIVSREPLVTGMGFPSGHTAAITTVGLLMYQFLPKKSRYLVYIWIGLVGLSRIYLGVHAPLDVLGGLTLGLCSLQLFLLARPQLVRWSKHLK